MHHLHNFGTIFFGTKKKQERARDIEHSGEDPGWGNIFAPSTAAFHTSVSVGWASKLVTAVDSNFDWLHVGRQTRGGTATEALSGF